MLGGRGGNMESRKVQQHAARIGIIGTGIIAHHHAKEYKKLDGVKIVAACDLIPAKLEKYCDEYGIENRYVDYREMLARDDLDAVDVCVHNNLHMPLTLKVLESGRHCYCEKPMAGSYADARTMLDTARRLGLRLGIQLNSLFKPQAHAARKLIEEGQLGKIYHTRSYGYRRRGRPFVDGYGEKEFNSKYWAAGGALYDMGVYHIALMLYLLGNPEVMRVSGQVYQEMSMDPVRREEGGFNVEELGCGFVRFKDGLTLDILEAWAIHGTPFPPCMIAGSAGGLAIWPEGRENAIPLEYFGEVSGYPFTSTPDLWLEDYRSRQANPELRARDASQAHWVATLTQSLAVPDIHTRKEGSSGTLALRGEADWLDTAEIALNTMLISEGIYLSSALGREVSAEEVIAESKSSAIMRQETDFGVLEY